MTEQNPDELALALIMRIECVDCLYVSSMIRLHHVISYVYRQILDYRVHGVRLRIDDNESTFIINAPASEHDFFSSLRSDLKRLSFHPYGWTIDFRHFGDDCWVEPLTFELEI